MSAVIATILIAVAVFFSSVSAEETNITSLYLEQNGSFVWLNGDASRVNILVEAFAAKGFVSKIEGPKRVACIVDIFAVLVVGEERGTAITCGVNSNLELKNNDLQYVEKVVEHVDWFVQYVQSPFTGEAEKNETSLRNDEERSCVFLEIKEFKKNKEGSRLYELQSRDRLILLQQALEKGGYVEKRANWTLCNAAFAKRRCVVEMDHIEGRQLMPMETVISCFTVDRTKVLENIVKNDIPVKEYVDTVINAVEKWMRALLDVTQEDTKPLK